MEKNDLNRKIRMLLDDCVPTRVRVCGVCAYVREKGSYVDKK